MRVRIDYDLCMGDGNCRKVCPEVFGYDDADHQRRYICIRMPPRGQVFHVAMVGGDQDQAA